MTTPRLVFILLIFISLQACVQEDKSMLIRNYKQIDALVQDRNFADILPFLNDESIEFIQAMENPENLNFEKMKSLGLEHKLPLFTLVYNYEMGEFMRNKSTNSSFLEYLGLTEIPIFSWFYETKLLEERTHNAGNGQIVLALLTPAEKQIARSVQFYKDQQGQYQLDLIGLLRYREKLLADKYNVFINENENINSNGNQNSSKNIGQSLTEEQFKAFIRN